MEETATGDGENRLTIAPRNKRGSYRRKKLTPRQTKHNRSRRLRQINEQGRQDGLQVQDNDMQDVDLWHRSSRSGRERDLRNVEDGGEVEHERGGVDARPGCESADLTENIANTDKLFPNSLLTSLSSELAISSYISRHNLSRQAQEDLFHLLQLHAPKNSLVASSVFTFKKRSSLSTLCVSQVSHYFCPQCHTSLSDNECESCPNGACGITLCHNSLPYYSTLSIAEQLQNLLRSECMIIIKLISSSFLFPSSAQDLSCINPYLRKKTSYMYMMLEG